MSEALKVDSSLKVEDYEFKPIKEALKANSSAQKVEFPEFSDRIKKNADFQKVIKSERSHARDKRFEVSPIVETFRGLKDQEEREIAEMIENEVQTRVARLKEDAFSEGYAKGQLEGEKQMREELAQEVEVKLDTLVQTIIEAQSFHYKMMETQRQEIYVFIKNLTKWIILRELSEDGAYLERLLEKILLEIQSKNNLLVQVNKKYVEIMPEVIATVEKKLGRLTNVRVEADVDLGDTGIILESDNGIINASLEEQLKNLEKLFEIVGINKNGESTQT
jgi:flagellar assembly protein FliH